MNHGRITRDAWAMGMARITARRSTCLRRAVGCVLMDADGFVLATGYNGVPKGMMHCNQRTGFSPTLKRVGDELVPIEGSKGNSVFGHACPGHDSPSGSNLNGCHAIHAEQNAMLRVADPRRIHTCYCTTSPCIQCIKMLMNTGCQRIIFDELYPHPESRELWEHTGREWIQYEDAIQ